MARELHTIGTEEHVLFSANNPLYRDVEAEGDNDVYLDVRHTKEGSERFFECFNSMEALGASIKEAMALPRSSAKAILDASRSLEESLTECNEVACSTSYGVGMLSFFAMFWLLFVSFFYDKDHELSEDVAVVCMVLVFFVGSCFFSTACSELDIKLEKDKITNQVGLSDEGREEQIKLAQEQRFWTARCARVFASFTAITLMLPVTITTSNGILYSVPFYTGISVILLQVLSLATTPYNLLVTHKRPFELFTQAFYIALIITSNELKKSALGDDIPENIDDCTHALCRSFKSSAMVGDSMPYLFAYTCLLILLSCSGVFKRNQPYKSIVIPKYLIETVALLYIGISITQAAGLRAEGNVETADLGRGDSNILLYVGGLFYLVEKVTGLTNAMDTEHQDAHEPEEAEHLLGVVVTQPENVTSAEDIRLDM
jgi:hypothetical protein